MRKPAPTDYFVTVDDIGKFRFARRTMRDDIAISVEQQRLSEGVPIDGSAGLFISAIADFVVLMVEGPDGWSPDELLATETYDETLFDNILKVWGAFRDKEDTFRPALPEKPAGGEATGEGASGVV